MKLQKLNRVTVAGDLPLQSRGAHFFARTFGQIISMSLKYAESSMSLPFSLRKAAVCFCWGLLLVLPFAASSQTNYYGANGTEYSIIGSLPSDQVWPDLSLGSNGGFLVWQDNITDGSGWGISARRLDNTLSGTLSAFRVNVTGTNDQENARVAMLKNGGAVFAWQGGVEGVSQHIYARFLSPTNTWLSSTDLLASRMITNAYVFYTTNTTTTITTNVSRTGVTYKTNTTTTVLATTNVNSQSYCVNPAVTVLDNSNVVVVWSSFYEAGAFSMQDVYGQILSSTGQKIGTNFLVNQFTTYNQRTPAVAALKGGRFVVTWVSEQQRVAVASGGDSVSATVDSVVHPSVDIYARLYSSNGVAIGNEFLVNSGNNTCANPSVASAGDGSFMVAWSSRDMTVYTNGWDVYARSFSSNGVGGKTTVVNTFLGGSQYGPHLSVIGLDYLIVWTSLGEDGSREGVFGRFIHADGTPVSTEFRVNTTTSGQQMQPAVASDKSGQFAVVWTGYAGLPNSFDLYAQRYLSVSSLLLPMSAPYVNAPFTVSGGTYQPQLVVSWPPLLGISVANYEVYVDGNSTPAGITTTNFWTMTASDGLAASSTHSFTVDYVTTDGRRAPISPSTSGTTWNGCNWSGIPCEWMQFYFGNNAGNWPSATADSDGDGVNNADEFRTGTNPQDSNSVLRQQLIQTAQGMYLIWNTLPGMTYQVQMTTNLTSWSNFGLPWFATGTNAQVNVPAGYYRVQLLR